MSADLGILIVTMEQRKPYLARLMRVLEPQLNDRVDVLTLDGAGMIGEKRQRLLESCDARWCCSVDDDDLVAPNYVSAILTRLDKDPDVVGFRLRYFHDGQLRGKSYHSVVANPHKKWKTVVTSRRPHEVTHYRTPNHLNPVRREMALAVGFKPLNSGEDHDFSDRLYRKFPAMREEFIDEFLYTYLYRSPHRRKESASMIVEDVSV
jgi:hypothetical protein